MNGIFNTQRTAEYWPAGTVSTSQPGIRDPKGLKRLELNGSIPGGGVQAILYSSVPALNGFDVQTEWEVMPATHESFECTKSLCNLPQHINGVCTPELEQLFRHTVAKRTRDSLVSYHTDVVMFSEPEPTVAMAPEKSGELWLWKCYIDIGGTCPDTNTALWNLVTNWIEQFDSAVFSAAYYAVSRWPVPNALLLPSHESCFDKGKSPLETEMNKLLDDSSKVIVKYRIAVHHSAADTYGYVTAPPARDTLNQKVQAWVS